jgi:citrate synthase
MPLNHKPSQTAASGLEGVIAAETRLSMVDGEAGALIIRGHRLEDVAGIRSFEWLLGQLWQGLVHRDLDPDTVRRDLGAARVRAYRDLKPIFAIAPGMAPMSALRLFVASVPEAADDMEMRLVATVAVGLAAAVRLGLGKPPVEPDASLGHAADLLRMVTARGQPDAHRPGGHSPDGHSPDGHNKALETYLVSAMDHGLNASTFTARVVASTRAGLPASVTAALCALQGPLHGGAPGPVLDMLDAIGAPENAEAWLQRAVAQGDRLMGFGHRVYRVRDPRSDVMKRVVLELDRNAGRLRYAEAVEQAALAVLARQKPGRSLQTNLEFYTALLLEALGIPRDAFTGIFGAARVVGWIAHAHEQVGSGRLIRPQSVYIGPRPAT